MNGLVTRLPEQTAFAIVGEPDRPEKANTFLKACGLSLSMRSDLLTRPPEIELLFLPGNGRFSGRADCNVLIVLEDCPRARRVSKKAHLVLADTTYRHGPPGCSFKLAEFRYALSTILR